MAIGATAAYGGLKPPPTRRPRRAHLHLSYSMALAHLLDTGRSWFSPDGVPVRTPLTALRWQPLRPGLASLFYSAR